jgi:penicillin amidase
MVRRAVRVLLVLLILAAALGAGAAFWVRGELRDSLAQLDGERQLPGLGTAVRVERDGLGIPSIRGASRADVARATGFLHAQDRFFQMDLARRRAAGELAGLVGARALVVDREIRIHRFRAQAGRALGLMAPEQRVILDAYVAGVNTGLQALGAPPFEYLMLRQEPARWLPEDSLLVVLSMFITLQDADGSYEATLATMRDVLPAAMADFLVPPGSEWDTPIEGEPFAVAPIPGPDVYDLRTLRRGMPSFELPPPEEVVIGSNNFAVAGSLTANGAALLANDMHLGIRVPNTWYRALLEWPDAGGGIQRLAGVTLPGVPALVAGSNTYVAWGFTNTYADWSDIVLLDTDPERPGQYLTPDGWRDFERYDEMIPVAGGEGEPLSVEWTIWGPVMPPDHRGRLRVYRWVAHSAEQLAATITPIESARTLEEALDAANGVGAPGQNFVVAARDGRIAWSVFGSIPRRVGIDGQLPASWSDGSRGWNGWLEDAEYPRVIAPPGGRIWTANARVVGGEMLARLGDGSYEIGSRARIIRERLHARQQFTPRDLLAIQLDTGADFLARWRDLLLRTLTADARSGNDERGELREVLEQQWTGQATADSAAYRFTRRFRENVFERVISFVLAECYEADPEFDYANVRRREAAIWQLITEQPLHLLDPQFDSWAELLLAAADATIEEATQGRAGPLRDRSWSEFNVVAQRHPLSGAIPFFGSRWLDMPEVPMPGDLYTPRVHWGAVGASERMIVSPGREAEGIMHMPTGQSGHPLSPFYANSHDAWVRGEPTPFLPGQALHILTLVP